MPTRLFYTDTASSLSIGGRVVKACSLSRGSGVVTKSQASSTVSQEIFDGGNILVWAFQVNAFSATTGTYAFNHWGFESNAMANYTAALGYSGDGNTVSVYTSGGAFRFAILSTPVASATEYGTAAAARSATSAAATARTINNGDYLTFVPAHNNFGAAASGYTLSFSYSGTSAAANGDGYVDCPDIFTEYVAPTYSGRRDQVYPQLLSHMQEFQRKGRLWLPGHRLWEPVH